MSKGARGGNSATRTEEDAETRPPDFRLLRGSAKGHSGRPSSGFRWRPIALPPEHGSWGFVLEPLVLALVVAPSLAGAAIAFSAFATFLVHRPAKVAYGDLRHGRRDGRATVAALFATAYLALAAVAFVAAIAASSLEVLLPMALAAPFALVFLYFDAFRRGRSWQAEAAAPVAFAAVAASIAIAAGWRIGAAFALWGLLVARALPSVVYVRSRLRLEKGKPHRTLLALVLHMLALVAVGLLAFEQLLPRLAILALVLLTARAAWGLSPRRGRATASQVGKSEVFFGALTVLLVGLGHWTGL